MPKQAFGTLRAGPKRSPPQKTYYHGNYRSGETEAKKPNRSRGPQDSSPGEPAPKIVMRMIIIVVIMVVLIIVIMVVILILVIRTEIRIVIILRRIMVNVILMVLITKITILVIISITSAFLKSTE